MGMEMPAHHMPNRKIGIMALGNLLHSQYDRFDLKQLRSLLPPEVDMISVATSGNDILSFLEDKQHLILLDDQTTHLNSGEILYWSQTLGVELKEIITISTESELESLVQEVRNHLQEWGAAVNH